MSDDVFVRRLDRERRARIEAERLLENKSRELYLANQSLKGLTETLEKQITDRTADLVIARDEALSASSSKSRYLAVMSHEVRSPLNGIIGALGLLTDTTLDTEQLQYTNIARKSAASLLSIVNNILDFSKIEANKMGLEPASFDVRELIAGVIDAFEIVASENSTNLVCEIYADAPKYLIGDGGRIRQVLVNLVDNALKFTTGGEVRITVGLESVMSDKIWLLFGVKDTGVGISEENQVHLFKEFWSQSPESSGAIVGTGLGLPISNRLIKIMGGEMGIESSIGEGSLFWFSVPFDKVPFDKLERGEKHLQENTGYPATEVQQSLSGRILLAEDNTANQMIAQAMLTKIGLHVDLAVNGTEAVEAISSRPYDVVLMDIDMPEMNGIEATRLIRKFSDASRASTPIVALTAYAMKGDRERFLAEGLDDYVEKPISRAGLVACLSHWLSKIPGPSEVVPDSDVPDESLFSVTTLETMIAEIGEENLSPLIDVFLNELDSRVDLIERAAAEGNADGLAKECHPLKSSAASFGAFGLSKLAREIEEKAMHDDLAAAQTTSRKLRKVAQETRDQLISVIEARR